jgi:hypothetical protein
MLYLGFSTSKAGPPDQSVERRLAAILAADVVGYSRLMRPMKPAGTLHYQQHSDKEHLRDGLVKAAPPP